MSAVQIRVEIAGYIYRIGMFSDGRKALPYMRRIRERLEQEYQPADLLIKSELHYVEGGNNHTELLSVATYADLLSGLEVPNSLDGDSSDSGTTEETTEETTAKQCSECGSPMVLRTRRATGKQFWGCSQYPRCKRTESFKGSATATITEKPTVESTTDTNPAASGELGQALGILRDVFGGMDSAKIEAMVNERVDAKMRELAIPKRKVFVIPDRADVDLGPIQHKSAELLLKLISGGIRSIWITGEAGMGKTHACIQICEALSLPYFIVTPVTDKYELFGYKDANGNYQETELWRFVSHDGPAVCIFDEIDGFHPNALVSINSVLANGQAIFPHGRFSVAENKMFLATANTTGEGPTLRYNARLAQDGALIDRFQQFVHWGLDKDVELQIALSQSGANARPAVEASWTVRENIAQNGIDFPWGPRRTYAMAAAHARSGVKIREAAILAGLSKLDKQQQKLALTGV